MIKKLLTIILLISMLSLVACDGFPPIFGGENTNPDGGENTNPDGGENTNPDGGENDKEDDTIIEFPKVEV